MPENEVIDSSLFSQTPYTPESPMLNIPDPSNIDLSPTSFNSQDTTPKSYLDIDVSKIYDASNKGNRTAWITTPQPQTERYPVYNPFMDNEEVYAQNQSVWSKWGNGIAKTAITAGGTFLQGLSSIPDLITSISSGDNIYQGEGKSSIDQFIQNSEVWFPNYYSKWEQEHPFQSAIPFRGGAANFWSDKVLKNLGFTIGAITSAVVQDLAIGAVTGGVGEIPLIAGQTGKAALWLNKVFTGANRLDNLVAEAQALGKSEQAIMNMTNLARMAEATKLQKAIQYTTSLYTASNAEAGMEARQSYEELKNNLTQDFYNKNGYNPTGLELENIEKNAIAAGNSTYAGNMAILTLSNAIQFENILKPWNPYKFDLRKGIQAKTADQAGRIGLAAKTINTAEDLNTVERVASGSKNWIGKSWDFVKPVLPNIVTEGVLEEGGQFAIAEASKNYFKRKYNGEIAGNVNDIIESIGYGLSRQFGTTEGLENMFIGSLIGGVTGPVMNKVKGIQRNRAGVLAPEAATTYAVNELNKQGVTGLFQQNYDNTADSLKVQQDLEQAVSNNNVFEFKNLQADSFYNFVRNGIINNRYDVRIEQLKLLKELPNEEINKLFGITEGSRESNQLYIDGLISKAESIRKSHDAISNVFQNPYNRRGNAKTDDQREENQRWEAFEEYKSALGKFNYNASDFNSRLSSVDQSLRNINPMLNSTLASKLTSRQGLDELRIDYKEEANRLQSDLDNGLVPQDLKASTKSKINELNTKAQAIEDLFKGSRESSEVVPELADFEINGRDPQGNLSIDRAYSADIVTYGYDINQINKGKKYAAEAYNHLTTREGFEDFMNNYEEWRNSLSLDESYEPEVAEDVDAIEITPEYSVVTGRNYNINKDFKYTLEQGTNRLKSPFGDIIDTYKTKEEAEAARDEFNTDIDALKTVKVLGEENGKVKVEDAEGKVQFIDKRFLDKAEKNLTEEEIVAERADFNKRLFDNQKELTKKYFSAFTDNGTPMEDVGEPQKPLAVVFKSTTYDAKDIKPYSQRQQAFFATIESLPEDMKPKLRTILVTQNNEVTAGLSGLHKSLTSGTIYDTKDTKLAPIVSVFVVQEDDGLYFVNNGEKVGKVGEQVDINNIVYATMPTSDLSYRSDPTQKRYVKGTPEEAASEAKEWQAKRDQIFTLTDSFPIYRFNVSKGIPIYTEKGEDGFYEMNPVVNTIIEKSDLNKQGLLQVSTGFININGENIIYPAGRVILQKGSIVTPVFGRNLNTKEANNIYDILRRFVTLAEKNEGLDQETINYLQGVVHYGEGKNSMFLTPNGLFNIGTEQFPFTQNSFTQYEKQIKDALKELYTNTNIKLLKENKPFREIIGINENNEPKVITWDSYQHYLLGDTYSTEKTNLVKEGASRGIDNIPFRTNIRQIDPTIDYDSNFQYKYAILTSDNENKPLYEAKTQEVKPKVETLVTITNVETKVFSGNNGNINYTIDAEGAVILGTDEETKATIAKISNPGFIQKAKEQDLTPEEYIAVVIYSKLQAPVVEPKVPENATAQEEKIVEEKKPEVPSQAKQRRPGRKFRIQDNLDYVQGNIDKELKWLEKNLSVPAYKLKNLINTTNGGYAFGMFYDSAIYVYENAEIGTIYHEAFHSVWTMYNSPKERTAMIKEFNSRKGSYLDRVTGEQVNYSQANEREIEEQLAEEFRDYIQNGKFFMGVQSTIGNFILDFFNSLIKFIERLISPEVSIEDIFKRINTGYYKYSPVNQTYTSEAKYSAIPGLNISDSYKVIKGMTSDIIQELLGNNETLIGFDTGEISTSQVFNQVKDYYEGMFTGTEYATDIPVMYTNGEINEVQYQQYQKLWNNLQSNWPIVEQRVKDYLKTFGVVPQQGTSVLEEESNVDTRESDVSEYGGKNSDSYVKDPFTLDVTKNASASIKLLLSTLVESEVINGEIESRLDKGTMMQVPVNYSRIFAFLLSNLYNLNTFQEKKAKLLEIAKTNPTYQRLVNRLKLEDDNISLADIDLQTKFFNVFSKQNPLAYRELNDKNGTILYSTNTKASRETLIAGWIGNVKQNIDKKGNIIVAQEDGTYQFNGNILEGLPTKTVEEQSSLLSKLGIDFTPAMINRLSETDQSLLGKSIFYLQKELIKKTGVTNITFSELGSAGNMNTIADMYLKANFQGDVSMFNIEGERKTLYIQNNTISNLVNDFNNATSQEDLYDRLDHLDPIMEGFSRDSIYLNDKLFDKEGKRTNFKFSVGYNEGKVSSDNDITTIDKMSFPERLMSELNQNMTGNFYLLVPADSKTEWMVSMQHIIPFSEINNADTNTRIYNIFDTYYATESAIAYTKYGDRQDPNYKSLMYDINGGYSEPNLDRTKLLESIKNNVYSQINFLVESGIIKRTEKNKKEMFSIPSINEEFRAQNKIPKNMTAAELYSLFKFLEVNYRINNVEIHKLFFGDVAQIKDPLKRYKSFLSPRETSAYNNPQLNNKLNEERNKAGNIQLENTDYGYWNHKEYMETVTMADLDSYEASIVEDKNIPEGIKDAYKKGNATDAQSWGFLPAYREIMTKSAGRWNNDHERLFQYLMAQDRLAMAEDKHYTYTNEKLKQADEKLTSKPFKGYTTLPIIKPIGSGFTNEYNTFLHKTSLAPLSYSMVRGMNMEKHYIKMWKQGISYLIVESGTKIGAGTKNQFFNEDGSVNTEEYTGINEIPFRYYGVQVETDGDHNKNTLGTQISKEITFNLRNNGIPNDYKGELPWSGLSEEQKLGYNNGNNLYSKIQRNIEALKELQTDGYYRLLDTFGIVDTGNGFTAPDKKIVQDILMQELNRREAPMNIKDALQLDENGNFKVPIEAMPNYQQIKNILYSYVDKLIAKPKVNGGPKIQMSGALFATEDKQIKKVDGKNVFVSSGLKFYEATYDNGNRTSVARMEVMLPMWFRKQIKSHPKWENKTDAEIFDYLNNTEEGKKLLQGFGFRIPTQELNSAEAFIVKGFSPAWTGDSIIVPEAITTKAGSDFDVDKLNTYLKNVYVDSKGDIKVIPFLGYGQGAINKFKEIINTIKEDNFYEYLMDFNDVRGDENALDNFDLGTDAKLVQKLAEKMYTQSLENEYFDSMEELLLLPENFERLIRPNSADNFKKIRKTLQDISETEFGSSDSKSVLDRMYMSRTRHLFIVGKSGVGIAASSQTNQAISQSGDIYLSPVKGYDLKEQDQADFGSGEIFLPHNKVEVDGDFYTTLSGLLDQDKNYISDNISAFIDGYVDIAKDPWISQIIQDPALSSIFLLLTKIGVDLNTTAMFMNQPIIREYIKALRNKGVKSLYKDTQTYNATLRRFAINPKTTKFGSMPKTGELKDIIIKFYTGETLTKNDIEAQNTIFSQFWRLNIISRQLFEYQQSSSFDTNASPDPTAQYKKQQKLAFTEEYNIFRSINKVMENTHLANVAEKVGLASDAISESFTYSQYRSYINQVVDNLPKFMGKRDFEKAARNIEESLITYLIHTNSGLNNRIDELMINNTTSVARKVVDLKNELKSKPDSELANNIVLQNLLPVIKANVNDVKNLMLALKVFDPVTSDMYTDALRELKNNPLTKALYGDLIRLSLLQSGLGNSPISFSKYLPYEDYSMAIKDILNNSLESNSLEEFVSLGAFYRNNWNNEDLVPRISEDLDINGQEQQSKHQLLPGDANWFYTIRKALGNTDPRLIIRKVHTWSPKSESKFITLAREVNTGKADSYGQPITRTSFTLLQRLDDQDGNPIIKYYKNGSQRTEKRNGVNTLVENVSTYATYISINAWGDGMRLQENYTTPRQSIVTVSNLNKVQEIPMAILTNGIRGIEQNLENIQENSIFAEDDIQLPNLNLPEDIKARQQEIIARTLGKKKPTRIPMNFKDGTGGRKMRPEFKGKSTIELIKEGKRIGTSRDFSQNYNKVALNPGDIVEFFDNKGNSVNVEITVAPYPVENVTRDQWSSMEGWEPSVYDEIVRKGNYQQYQFKLIDPLQSGSQLGLFNQDITPEEGTENICPTAS